MALKLNLSVVAFLMLTSQALSADKDELQGTWIVESSEIRGRKIDLLKGKLFTFSGDRIKRKSWYGSYKTDDSETPRHIDITLKGVADGKDVTLLGIYRIEGDTLTICNGTAKSTEGEALIKQDPRPIAFDSKHGGLTVYKRKKK